jgi:hypothetical protein
MAVEAGGIARAVGEELGSGLRGEVVFPGDRGYDTARAVFNGMIDRRPLAVIRSLDASDVVRCITFARRLDLPLSVPGGGHSVAGNAVGDGAVMLDLSGMKLSGSIQRRGQSGPNPGSPWASSTTQPRRSDWRRRWESYRRPGSRGSRSAAGWAGSTAVMNSPATT